MTHAERSAMEMDKYNTIGLHNVHITLDINCAGFLLGSELNKGWLHWYGVGVGPCSGLSC